MANLNKIAAIISICALNTAYAGSTAKICFNQTISRYTILDVVTQGKSISADITNDGHCLSIKANNSNLNDLGTVNWVKNSMGEENWNLANMVTTQKNVTKLPNGLNLAVKVNLTINSMYSCYNLIFGQYSYSNPSYSGYYWWVFSNINSISDGHSNNLTYVNCEKGATNTPTNMILQPTGKDNNTFDLQELLN